MTFTRTRKLVSIIIPVREAGPLVDEAIASVHSQTFKDYELIVVDDPSGTGPGATRNRGLELAKGDYIAFCDADDYLSPTAIELMVDAIDGVDMVCGSFMKFGAFEMLVTHPTERLSRKRVSEYVMQNLKDPKSHQMLSGCWAKLYRRNMIGRFPDIPTAEDMVFNYDYLRFCTRDVRFISDVVYYNRKHSGTVTTTFNPGYRRGLFCFNEGLKYVEAFLRENLKNGVSADQITDAIDSSKTYHSILYFMRICEQLKETQKEVFRRLYP